MGFMLPTFKKCLCCVSLRTGSFLIGYVSAVFSTLALTLISLSLYNVIYYVDHTINDTITETKVEKPEDVHEVATSLYIAHAYLIIVFLYNLLISLMLIVGLHKANTKYMRDYFKAGLFLLLLALATVVLSTVFLHFIVTIALLKWSVIVLYCLIMVRSHYLDLEEANKPPVIEMESLYNPPRASHLYA
ncbi:unnamed protein product [Pieris macdunnoughi]|uniref:Uncharacterized protein n=1 Tax=Pieris macdunnoughi TaxID=345717 RepID=A0A821SEB8_9NEOP|nr:unnamed protein product [Pieris macdunnoughi]